MKPRYLRFMAGLALLGLAFLHAQAAPVRVLFFSKSAGWEHSAIKRTDGKPSFAETVLTQWGPKHGIEFTFSKDGSLISPNYLAQFDAVLFYTTGDLTSVGTDGTPAMTPAGKQAIFDYVAGGKGFVGVHSTSDTFHTNEHGGGNPPIGKARYQIYGDAADPFIKFLGGEFVRHGPQQVARATITDAKFPGFEKIGSELKVQEEWYSLKEFAPDLHVLLVMQTEGMNGADYNRAPYPLAWVRKHGKGRVGYQAMGHREDVWQSPAFESMMIGMIEWAAGKKDADITPNLEKVAPGSTKIQPLPADVKTP